MKDYGMFEVYIAWSDILNISEKEKAKRPMLTLILSNQCFLKATEMQYTLIVIILTILTSVTQIAEEEFYLILHTTLFNWGLCNLP